MLKEGQQKVIKEGIYLMKEHLARMERDYASLEVTIPELKQRIGAAEKRLENTNTEGDHK